MSNTSIRNKRTATIQLLHKGDIIHLEKGMNVYASIPGMFIRNQPFDDEPHMTAIMIGQQLTRAKVPAKAKLARDIFDRIKSVLPVITLKHVEDFVDTLSLNCDPATFDTSIFVGEYTVVKTVSDSGGTGHGPSDYYPNGWHVYCEKADGTTVNFYQTGCFTTMLPDIKPINR